MRSVFLLLAAVSAFLGVAMGAFGAHGLKAVLSSEMMTVYKTAVHYQLWHALGLGIIAILQKQCSASKLLLCSGWLMFSGILLFSGSLFLLSLSQIKWLGMITPFGGMAFLLAWLLLGIFAWQNEPSKG